MVTGGFQSLTNYIAAQQVHNYIFFMLTRHSGKNFEISQVIGVRTLLNNSLYLSYPYM